VQASTSFGGTAERNQQVRLPGPAPSAHNITLVYKRVVRFNDDALTILSSDYTENAQLSGLRLFVDHFIQHEYLKQLQREMRDRVQEAVGESGAFKTVDIVVSGAPTHDGRAIVPGILAMAAVARQLSEVLYAIPPYLDEVVAIILDSMYRFTTQCELIFDDVLGGHVSDDVLRAVSDSKYGIPSQLDADIERMLLGRELFKENIVSDIKRLSLVASLSDGLHWLADELTTLFCRGVSRRPVPRGHRHKPSTVSGISGTSTGTNSIIQETSGSWVSDNIAQAVNDMRKLSRHCIIALSVEFRCHCVYYINELKKGLYFTEDVASEPDSFITDLNRDISLGEERLAALLPHSSVRNVFSSLGRMVCRAMVSTARSITRINANGYDLITASSRFLMLL